MKKISLMILAAATVGLVACGGTTPAVSTSETPSTTSEAPASTSEEEGYTKKTVKEAIDWCNLQDKSQDVADQDELYEITGIMEGLNHSDSYGNCYLTDGEYSIQVYGATGTMTAFDGKAGQITYTNPKDAPETLKDYNNGEKVTCIAMVDAYKGTPELKVVMIGHVADSSVYKATTAATENGTFTIDKNENLKYGDTITVTCVPASGYQVAAVKNITNYGNMTGVAGTTANVYTVTATCKNEIAVTFEPIPEGTAYTYTATNLGLTGSYGDAVVDGSEGKIAYHQLMMRASDSAIQMRNSDKGQSWFGNTVAYTSGIKKITVTYSGKSYDNDDAYEFKLGKTGAYVAKGTDDLVAETAVAAAETLKMSTVAGNDLSWSIAPTAKDLTYFSFKLLNTYSHYWASLKIELY